MTLGAVFISGLVAFAIVQIARREPKQRRSRRSRLGLPGDRVWRLR